MSAAIAAVLLGLGLTGAHVWTAFIATLSLSVLILAAWWVLRRRNVRTLWRFSSVGAAIAAAVLLGLGLTGAHVWTAFIATLSLSVLIPVMAVVRRRWSGLLRGQPLGTIATATDSAARRDS